MSRPQDLVAIRPMLQLILHLIWREKLSQMSLNEEPKQEEEAESAAGDQVTI